MFNWIKILNNCPKEADNSPKHLDRKSKKSFKQARELENINAYKNALQIKSLYQESAKLGNPFSMNNLVNIYYYGSGVPVDEAKELEKLNIPMGDLQWHKF